MKNLFYSTLIMSVSMFFIAEAKENPAIKQDTIIPNTTLWYKHPAENWMQQALPIGNGGLGAMIFGGVEKEHIQFNEKSLWSGSTKEESNLFFPLEKMDSIRSLLALGKVVEANDTWLNGKFSLPREHFGDFQPFGDIYLEFDHGNIATNYHRELDLSNAVVSVSYEINGVKYTREYFANYPSRVVVMRISSNQYGKINLKVTNTTSHEKANIFVDNNLNMVLNGKMPDSNLEFCSGLKISPQGGTSTIKGNSVDIKNANSVVLILSAKTNYTMNSPTCTSNINLNNIIAENLKKATTKGFSMLLKEHLEDYSLLYNRTQLNLETPTNRRNIPTDEALKAYTKLNKENAKDGGDPSLESLLFNYGRYLMIASSREGNLPANLQGIWNDSKTPAWSGDYHTDINLEMNYWLNGPTNLPECFSPFADYVDFLQKSGKKTAKKYFNAKGFFVNIYTNPWGYSEPRWLWTGASGWLCQNLYDHYLFTNNEEYLEKKAYPIMKESCLFYLDVLTQYTDKSLAVVPSLSPEVNFRYTDGKDYRLSAGASIDQQIVHDLFTNTIEASEILGKDLSFRNTLKDRLQKLSPPIKVGINETIQEWIEDWQAEDLQHRHISHLYALYPGRMLDSTNAKKFKKAFYNSLELRGENHTGWGTTWRIACFARLYDGEKAHSFFKSLLRHTTDTKIVYRGGGGAYENLLTCHSPFQIDSNFGYTAAVAEMLLQSHLKNDKGIRQINLLPALPKAWNSGKAKGLVARGGYTIDIEWKDGVLTKAIISSKKADNIKIVYNGKTVDLKMKKGEVVSLNPNTLLVIRD